ncbi:hypothetical protein PQR39_36320 [Paraburkholderia sediminicola]|uniref:hypothetical protein n=1 Tax=Paraburkholderia sediminicola TaxID=458836 RepID=UPI0038BA4842
MTSITEEKEIFYNELLKIGECITAEEWDADELSEGSEAYVMTHKLAEKEKMDRWHVEREMWDCIPDFRDFDGDGKVIPGTHGKEY